MLKMSKGFKVMGSEENPTSKSSTIINVYSDSKKSFYGREDDKNNNAKLICAWIATSVGFILSIISLLKLLTLNKYVYMAYSVTDWERVRMLSLDEMVHVAIELEKAGLDVPLLIGGATTSPLHTALKIAPVYHAPVIHLKDASQNATVAARLMNPNQKEEFVKKLSNKYQQLREKNQEKQVETVSLEEAKANRLNLF